jgi:DNA-binding transcriptional ArsR family regulator
MRSLASAPTSIDRTFAALADPTRRGIVELLGEGSRRAGELAEAFDMTPPAMSRHLKVLRATGLVEESGLEEDARVRVYHLRRKPFSELSAWVADVEAYWADQLAAFKAHAEKTRPAAGARPSSSGPRKKKDRLS